MVNALKSLVPHKENFTLQSFLVTCALFLGTFLITGWWSESYQYMYDTFCSGELTGYYLPSARDFYPEYMPGAAFVFNCLGALLHIRWSFFFMDSLLFISLWVLFYHLVKQTAHLPVFSRVLILLFFSVLFAESVSVYHMVRITMFAGIAGIMGIFTAESSRPYLKKILPYLFLFAVALWIRSNVHLFVLLFVSAAFILKGGPVKKLLPFWIAFALAFLYFCKMVFWTDHSHDPNFYYLHNAEFKLHVTGDYTPDLQLENHLDSVKYQAIRQDILGDEVSLKSDFYDRIGIFTNYGRFSPDQLPYGWHTFYYAVHKNMHLLVLNLVLLILFMRYNNPEIKRYRLKILLLFLFFYALVFALSFVKMDDRFFIPFHALLYITLFFLYRPPLFFRKEKVAYLTAALLPLLAINGFFIHKNISAVKNEYTEFNTSSKWLARHFKDCTVVFNSSFLPQNKPYETFWQRKEFKDFYIYNFLATQLSPAYRPYLENECNCNIGNLYPFYDYLLDTKEKVILVDDKERINMLRTYLGEVYHKSYLFEPVNVPGKQENQFHVKSFTEKNLELFLLEPGEFH